MIELKLDKLPDRVPVKLTISVTPEINGLLSDYAKLYKQLHGREEAVVELIPHMLSAF